MKNGVFTPNPATDAQAHSAPTSNGAGLALRPDAALSPGRDLPRLEPRRIFDGARLLILGGTGFLGKIFWIMLLHRYPNVGKIYLLVRGNKDKTSEQRFWSEVVTSEALLPLREQHGDGFDEFIRRVFVPINGDVGRPNCGIADDLVKELKGTIDAVINVAGVVDFNPPLDEALDANAFGAQNLVALCRALGDAPLLHTSTCYVVGNRKGTIYEDDPSTFPFPRADELGRDLWDPAREIADCLDIVAQARSRCNDAFRQSEFLEKAKKNLEQRGEPSEGAALDAELKNVKRKWVSARLVEAGKERAEHWGWPNIYTYTKSIGEQIIAKSGVPFAIARPACCESTMEFPFPAWNEGIGTSAPIIFLVMKGHHQILGRDALLDFIPSDTVCAGMLLSLAELLEGTHAPVYQYGASDVNGATSERFGELIGLYKRKYYQRTNKGNPFVNFLQAYMEPAIVSRERFNAVGPKALARTARQVASVLRAAPGPVAGPARASAKALDGFAKQEEKIDEIIHLFGPFTYDQKGPFSCANTRRAYDRLSDEDKALLPWTPDRIDWADYWMNQHMPAMEQRVLPWLEDRYKRELKPLAAHETLVTLVREMAERHDLALAFQRLEETGLSRVTFRDVERRAETLAFWLLERGLKKGDRVLLSGQNHPDWPISYFAVLMAGGTVCPVDPNLEGRQIANVLRESEARFAILDQHVEEKSGETLRAAGTTAEFLALHDVGVIAESGEMNAAASSRVGLMLPEVSPDDVASLIFTSGTTGKPKGVMLTHKNFTSIIAALAPLFPLTPKDRVLSVLPLHHTFEFSCGLLLPFSRGARIVYLDELTGERVTRGLKEGRITGMVGVPAVWQLLERRILSQVESRGPIAEAFLDAGGNLNRFLAKTLGFDLGRVLFGPVHDGLGGNIRFLISGGAALPPDTQKLFAGLGLKLTEGYGLTEASPVLTVAKAGSPAGQVGKPIPGVEIRIDSPDANGVGEVLAKGPNVMMGYTDADATRDTFHEGWLKTGDLGKFDKKGNLVIVGRSKDVVVTASGENVYPDDVERLLGQVPHIDELAIVGIDAPSGGERLACLAVAAADSSLTRAERNERALASLRAAIAKLPYVQQAGVVQLYEAKLPRTATRKVKRNEVRALIERTLAGQAKPDAFGPNQSQVRVAIASVKGRRLEEIHASSSMVGDLGFDSLALTELLVALEATYGAIEPDALTACVTVADVERLVNVAAVPSVRPAPRVSRYQIQGGPTAATATGGASRGDKSVPKLPEFVQERGKSLIGKVQDLFYGEVMKPRIYGQAYIPHNRNVIVVANHQSHLDMGFVRHALGHYGEDLVSLAAQDYFFEGEPWKRAFFENFSNLRAIDRKAGLRASERQAAEVLNAGRTMLIFPEGTRSTDGDIHEFKSLVGHLALYYGVDILPVYIGGTGDAMPKGARLPKQRELLARIGPVFTVDEMKRLTTGMKLSDASREVARLSREALLALKRGEVLEFDKLTPGGEIKPKHEHPLVTLFSELERKFDPAAVKNPISFYFTLGGDEMAKWTVFVRREGVEVRRGKPDSGTADCVLKTSPEIFSRIVREAYTPGPAEFMSGAVKSNDISLLMEFQRVFQLDRGMA
jgi:long-chain acyl-CoA synthetase